MIRLEYMPLDELVPAEVNPKDHDTAGLRASVDRFGFIEPIVLDERTGRLVGGHGRREDLLARQSAGAEAPEGVEEREGRWFVPVSRGWASRNDADAKAALVALNRIPELGGWEERELADVLGDLLERGLTGTGFDTTDYDDLMAAFQEAEHDPDPESTVSRLAIRSIVLDYPIAEYEQIAVACGKARADRGIDSNAELFAALVEPWAESSNND